MNIMTKSILRRDDIIKKYQQQIHPAGEELPNVPLGLTQTSSQLTFGVSFSGSSEQSSPQSGEASAAKSDVPEGFKITPMLHQESTAQDIVTQLQNGVTTAVLGDPLGAGKTLQALLVFFKLRQKTPDLHLVVTVPDVVIPDWKDALESIGISAQNCRDIMAPKDLDKLDIHTLPIVLFVKQSLTLNEYNKLHIKYLAKLRAIYERPSLCIFDEQTTPSPTISKLFSYAKLNLRLILSGTIVTNSIQDIIQPFRGKPIILKDMMEKISQFHGHYFTSRFCGGSDLTPGEMLLIFLSLSRVLHESFYSRMSSSLPIALPDFEESVICIDEEDTTVPADFSCRDEPMLLLTGVGTSVKGNKDTNKLFNDSHSEHFYRAKLQKLITELCLPNDPIGISDVLVVTANQSTSFKLGSDLRKAAEIQSANYIVILIADEERETKMEKAHAEGKSIIFLTESKRVEGFNIQKHLSRVICFDAVRDQADYDQARGRAVRGGNLTKHVKIEQYCTEAIAEYVKTRTSVTRKGKTLLELIHADPAAIFLLITEDVLTRQKDKLRTDLELDSGFVLNSMRQVLGFVQSHLSQICASDNAHQVVLDLIGVLTCQHPSEFDLAAWRKSYTDKPSELSNPFWHLFLFEEGDDLLRFAFDTESRQIMVKIRDAIGACKAHFKQALALLNLENLLQPQYLNLANGFHLTKEYLCAIQQCLLTQVAISDAELGKLIKLIYSLPDGIFTERATIKASLLSHLKSSGYFKRCSFRPQDNGTSRLYAFIDATENVKESSDKVLASLVDGLESDSKSNCEFVCQTLYQLGAYPSVHGKAIEGLVSSGLYDKLKRHAAINPSIYLNESYDHLAEQVGKLASWISVLLDFTRSCQEQDKKQFDGESIISRCVKLLDLCSKDEKTTLRKTYPELKKTRGASVPETRDRGVNPTAAILEHYDKRQRSFEEPSGGAASAASSSQKLPTSLQSYSMFNSSASASQSHTSIDPKESSDKVLALLVDGLKYDIKYDTQFSYRTLYEHGIYSSVHKKTIEGLVLSGLYNELERRAATSDHRMYLNESYDELAMHAGKSASWISALLEFAKLCGTQDVKLFDRASIISRCVQLLDICSKKEQSELCKKYSQLKETRVASDPEMRDIGVRFPTPATPGHHDKRQGFLGEPSGGAASGPSSSQGAAANTAGLMSTNDALNKEWEELVGSARSLDSASMEMVMKDLDQPPIEFNETGQSHSSMIL